ncbi:MAG: hypothetical protein KF729_31695, partial [Sandaracinaceae bacterium]|nr:hypothetical protein [Sandaracinaceae bacterium]
MDEELARLARCNVRDRLALGVALHRLGKGFQELGFRSFAMYVRERVSQGARWCGDTRALARRLEERPVIRAALVSGRIGWSMAEMLARHVGPDDEAELLAAVEGATVREVREALRTAGGEVAAEEDEAYCTVDLPVTASELLALEATKAAIEHVNGGVVEPGHWLECLVFEGASTLFAKRPDLASQYERFAPTARRERGLVEEPVPARRAVTDEACVEEPVEADDPVALDAVVRDVGARLASRDLWLGALLSRFMLARGWVALGYASEQSYFDERLGLARSTARGRITLARRVEHLERLGDAVRDGEVGYEQASLIARVAGPDTIDAWVTRAKARTYVHLAEEVRAVELLARVEGAPARHLAPPDDDELEAVIAFERAVLSGELLANAAREAGADSEVRNDAVQMSGSAAEDAGAVQMSVGLP